MEDLDPQSRTVRNFYGYLNETGTFKTRINSEKLTSRVNELVEGLSEDVLKRYYGSGIAVPEHLDGARILDMGCGSGTNVFILSKLVGPRGFVVGVDFCQGLIDTAKKDSEHHFKKWGYDKPNFEFRCANLNDISELGYQEGSFDAVISSGVFCLCPDKNKPFSQAFKMLKGGCLYYTSDSIISEASSRLLPLAFITGKLAGIISREASFFLATSTAKFHNPKISYAKKSCGVGVGIGCLLWHELSPMCQGHGFTSPYLQRCAQININNEEMNKALTNAMYLCCTHRIFKLPPGAKRGPAMVVYLGNLEDYPDSFPWDIDLTFKKDEPIAVDGELATILASTEFSKNFSFEDFTLGVTTSRNQNPFEHMHELIKNNQAPPFAYEVY